MNDETLNQPTETKRGSRRMLKIALAGALTAGVLATSGVAHAGYRWKRVAPSTTQVTTTTQAPPVTEGYRWR